MSDQYQPPQSDLVTEGSFDNVPLFSPRGRLGRIRYLAHSFWATTVIYVAGFVLIAATEGFNATLSGIATIIMLIALAVVTFIFTIKRCHDFNASGWWSILALVPLANFFFVFKSGTPTANRFGSAPPPNTVLLWIGGLAFPFFFIVGILAAIAIPAYQDYSARAQIGAAMTSVSAPKTALAYFYKENGHWPDENDLATLELDEPLEMTYSIIYVYPDTGQIEAVMRDLSTINPSIANGSLEFTPKFENNVLKFDCMSDNIDPRFLPRSCQGTAIYSE
ncbi:MAG: DUF805 domain-containing protein [Gammaproteobacteria bacterium]